MQIKITKKTTYTILLVVFFIFLDKLFKTLCLRGHLNEPKYLISDIFSLHFTANENIAFSLPFSGPILNIFIGAIIIFLLTWWIKLYRQTLINKTENDIIFSLTILIFGAALNFMDRLKFGYVVDYFDLKYFTVFNIADTMINLSTIYIMVKLLKKEKYKN